ncbi:MAG: FAD binding domain-containing protein [Gaiellaceae bacterium]
MARPKDAFVPELIYPSDVDDAAAELARLGDEGEPIAGATWVMLGPLYRRPTKMNFVSVGDLAELKQLETTDATATIGAAVTHSQLVDSISGDRPLAVLAEAAAGTPRGIGNVATVAGNICANPYAAADLVPALLVLDGQVEIRDGDAARSVALADLTDGSPGPGALVTGIRASAISEASRSVYERITVRASGEEAVASVALAVELEGNTVSEARVAFGSVEARSRRCAEAENALVGKPLDAETAAAAGEAAAAAATIVGDADAPADYKSRVLPGLMKRAAARIAAGKEA